MSLDYGESNKLPPVTASKVKLYSGEYFDYSKPDETPITMVDVAVGLSNVCRFAGQLEQFYSVAEHSVICLAIARLLGCSLEEKRAVLLHDAAECVMGDMPTPLKILLPGYKAIEKTVDASIRKRFGIGVFPVVKQIDLMALRAEKETLKGGQDKWHLLEGVRDVSDRVSVQCLTPATACHDFLDAALALGLIDATVAEKQQLRNLEVETLSTMSMLVEVIAENNSAEATRDLNLMTEGFGKRFGTDLCESLLRTALVNSGYAEGRDGEATTYKKNNAIFKFYPDPLLN